MAWGSSSIFQSFIEITLLEQGATGWTGIDDNSLRAALYDNDITPDKDAPTAETAYNTGQWAISGNEVTDSDGSPDWAAKGPLISGVAATDAGSGVTMVDATDTTHSNTVTLTNAFGCLVFDDDITAPTADLGISYHYFGGGQSVTAGTFTIVWHANGLFRITVS